MKIKHILNSSNESVKKYVFEDKDILVESVIYKYPDYQTRATICISTQCGCRVGCKFCGTGNKFVKNLTKSQMIDQVILTFKNEDYENIVSSKKLQIMFMSMGEPSHNFIEVKEAVIELNKMFPSAELLISTIGTNENHFIKEIIALSKKIDKIGLQFSIHHYDDKKRNLLIPYQNKLNLKQIARAGKKWSKQTSRKVFCNYVVTKNNNKNYDRLFKLFKPQYFNFTFSVLCNANENIKTAFYNNKDDILSIHNDFLSKGYNVRIFDPAGQDDIGGGCGQLWYFQKFIKNK